MTPQKKLAQQINNSLSGFLNELPRNFGRQTYKQGRTIHGISGQIEGLQLTRVQTLAWDNLIQDIYDLVSPYYHQKGVNELLDKAFNEIFRGRGRSFPERKRVAIENVVKALTQETKTWEVHFNVQNMEGTSLPLVIGPVRFERATPERKEHLMQTLQEILTGNDTPLKDQEGWLTMFEANFKAPDFGTFAVVLTKAITGEAARQITLKKLRLALDVINFYGPLIQGINFRAFVYLPGDAKPSTLLALSIDHYKPRRVVGKFQTVGPLDSLRLSIQSLDDARQQAGFDRACQLLDKETPNKVEQRLLAALHWAGRASAEMARNLPYQDELGTHCEESFLFYTICLEALFIKPGNSNEITKRLSSRCGGLIAKVEADKKDLQKQIASLYDLRSGIVHDGKTSISPSELDQVRDFANESIIKLLTSEEVSNLAHDKDLDDWLIAKCAAD